MEDILQSDNFTELLLEGDSEFSRQKRIVSIGKGLGLQKGLFLKLKPSQNSPDSPVASKTPNDLEDMLARDFPAESPGSPAQHLIGLIERAMQKNGAEGISFGFPMSFN